MRLGTTLEKEAETASDYREGSDQTHAELMTQCEREESVLDCASLFTFPLDPLCRPLAADSSKGDR